MKRPEFTREQEDWLCVVLDDWYLSWKGRVTDGQHRLGIAKEELKGLFCGESLNDIGFSMARTGMIEPMEYLEYYVEMKD